MDEFDCIECGRHIILFCGPATHHRCAACVCLPGWFNDPELARVLDPDWRPEDLPASRRRKDERDI
jgi:hypothetical protein